MDEIYKEAFAEVLEVLKNSDKEITEKIPEKFIAFLNQNKDDEYIVKIDFNDENWEKYIRQESQAILALIYREYLVSSEERKKLLSEESKEQIRYENELREKYNPDNLFKNKHSKIPDEFTENTQLIEIQQYPWYKRLYSKILAIFGIRNK